MTKNRCPNCGSKEIMASCGLSRDVEKWWVWCKDCGLEMEERDTYKEANKE